MLKNQITLKIRSGSTHIVQISEKIFAKTYLDDCSTGYFLHDSIERCSFLGLLLRVHRDFLTEFTWIRHCHSNYIELFIKYVKIMAKKTKNYVQMNIKTCPVLLWIVNKDLSNVLFWREKRFYMCRTRIAGKICTLHIYDLYTYTQRWRCVYNSIDTVLHNNYCIRNIYIYMV